jgi:hypothetical protein
MQIVTSFHASAIQPDQLNGIMADYLALERAGLRRQLLAKRFAVLAAVVAVTGFSWLSVFGFCFSLAFCAAVPVWAWAVELGHERRLRRRLEDVPSETMHAAESAEP